MSLGIFDALTRDLDSVGPSQAIEISMLLAFIVSRCN